ncbi:MAG: NgoFVII family restriction endonuclease [Paludibacteraceae bacterium]|nr:NgoFVII family restriction endonuclease [Paludibacteraceae bacterium]
MELLLTKNPIVGNLQTTSTEELYKQLVEQASDFNIATGYITNESIVEIQQAAQYRLSSPKGPMKLNLLIGMNYIEGFTRLQYNAIQKLHTYLAEQNIGKVMLSPKALYHGKMYSFLLGSQCLASFIGSSNLGSFVGTSQNNIESDAVFTNSDGNPINQRIIELYDQIGVSLSDIPEIKEFTTKSNVLLDGHDHVAKISSAHLKDLVCEKTGIRCEIPLKSEPKSNLNTYFGAGKIKGRYSPRSWYEVEIVISNKLNCPLPGSKQIFTVVTEDGYEFDCQRQGDYDKNLRSSYDLKILGKWIKGQMENAGVLEILEPVTDETFRRFGKSKLMFEELKCGKWLMSLR